VEVDVSGYAACTTEAERRLMRAQLGIEVTQSSLTPYGAPRVGGGPVSHESVLTARQAYPKDTCQQLAERLGCSTSTIKRHLRRDREQRAADARPDPSTQRHRPTIDEVLEAFDALESSQVA
jgi:DNA-binding MarR family transcriptional regulator